MGIPIQGAQVVIVAFLSTPLALTALGLRLWSRRLQGVALAFNDYMAIAATVIASAAVSICVADVFIGAIGVHTAELLATRPHVLSLYIIFTIPGEILWAAANTCVKFSILSLYTIIFPGRAFHRICYAMMAVSTAYFISVLFEAFILCTPVQYNWDKTIPGGKCHDQPLAYLIAGIMNLAIDAFIVALPLPKLYGLHIPLAKRVAIAAMFGLGALICVLSLLRILSVESWDLTDPTYTGTGITAYSILEPTLGVVNACLPTMRPALGVLFKNGPFGLGPWTVHGSHATGKTSRATRTSHYFEQIKEGVPPHKSHGASNRQSHRSSQGNNITVLRERDDDHSRPGNEV